MALFAIADAQTATLEGGYQANPTDKGNFYQGKLIGTNRGIAAPTLAAYLGHAPTVAEMRALDAETAAKIRRTGYWVPVQGDKIANQSVAGLVYDFAVHSGPETATIHVQHALRDIGRNVVADGKVGPKTLAAINDADQQVLFDAIKASRADLLKHLATSNPDSAEWLNGWLKRLDKFVFPVPAPAPPAPVAG